MPFFRLPRFPRLALVPLLCAALAAMLGAARLLAHEIPARVTVLAFIKPERGTLRVVARVPLAAMRDVDWPLRDGTFLDLSRTPPLLADAARLWIADYLTILEGGDTLAAPRIAATRVSLPADRSFARWDDARALLASPALPDSVAIPWQQAMLDVDLAYAIRSDSSRFAIHPALAHLGVRTQTVLHWIPPSGGERVFTYDGDPGLIPLEPRWYQSFARFVREGFLHILAGVDHLLFILCLVLPVRRLRPLVAVVTAFTVAHSITLIAAALGFAPTAAWFPPLIELLIALSILVMAIENAVAPHIERRWIVAFAFGLVHGFGFSFALGDSLQFAGSHLVTALLAFNVGVELGQLAVLALALPLLALLFRWLSSPRGATLVVSALVAHTAWHWCTERGTTLMAYRFSVPVLDADFVTGAMRLMALALIAGAAMRLLDVLFASRPSSTVSAPSPDAAGR